MGKVYLVSDVTGKRYDSEEYANHGYGGMKNSYKDLPHDEYPYSYEGENKTSDELLAEFMAEVGKELHKIAASKTIRDEEFDKRLCKATANWIINPVAFELKERGYNEEYLPNLIDSASLRDLVVYVEFTDFLTFTDGKRVLTEMIDSGDEAWTVMERMGLLNRASENEIEDLINAAMIKYPEKVEAYRNGKMNILGMFMGEVMRNIKGANPAEVTELLKRKLE